MTEKEALHKACEKNTLVEAVNSFCTWRAEVLFKQADDEHISWNFDEYIDIVYKEYGKKYGGHNFKIGEYVFYTGQPGFLPHKVIGLSLDRKNENELDYFFLYELEGVTSIKIRQGNMRKALDNDFQICKARIITEFSSLIRKINDNFSVLLIYKNFLDDVLKSTIEEDG